MRRIAWRASTGAALEFAKGVRVVLNDDTLFRISTRADPLSRLYQQNHYQLEILFF
jgi:hypothetical protein